MPQALLQLENVGVRFGGLRAVDDVSLAIAAGERRAIIGPNGAGKTTLFNAITGLVPTSTGRILLAGQNIARLSVQARARRGIGRTFQITNLFPSLSLRANMRLGLRGLSAAKFSIFGRDVLRPEDQDRMEAALAIVRLDHRADLGVADLSYGEQRQLELAMALMAQPKLLFLDEPAAGLSPAERSIVVEIIRGLPRSLTLVLIEHDMELVLNLVDRVTCLNNGTLLVEAPPSEIRGNALVQDVYLGRPRKTVTDA